MIFYRIQRNLILNTLNKSAIINKPENPILKQEE